MKKFLFLDVDGVLNSSYYFKKQKLNKIIYKDLYRDLDKRNLLCLKYISDKISDLEIILSSTWRYFGEHKQILYKAFNDIGIPIWTDITPILYEYRGIEIQKYLDARNIDKKNIVILDDDCNMCDLIDRLVKTDFYDKGLCYKHVLKVLDMFNDDDR